jgi:hypothetical protein
MLRDPDRQVMEKAECRLREFPGKAGPRRAVVGKRKNARARNAAHSRLE